jgi:dCMP deaminase
MDKKEYFMGIAYEIAKASKDPSSKVGCVIVDDNQRIVSTGYNGMVSGCSEDKFWETKEMKYATVIHAEMNALLYARKDVTGHTMFTTHAPCANCLKHTLQAGIRKIFYDDSSIMRRTDVISNKAVMELITATDAKVISTSNNMSYDFEIYDHINNLETEKW